MSPDEEFFDDFLDEPPAYLDRLPYALRVAELLRKPGAMEHWRRRCHQSFLESQERDVSCGEWNQQKDACLLNAWMRKNTERAILRWIDEGNPCYGHDAEESEDEVIATKRLFTPDGNLELVSALLPGDLADDQEPYAGGPLPFSRRYNLSLSDCYFVLALVHDAERRDATRINPFCLEDERQPNDVAEAFLWVVRATHMSTLRLADQMTLDDCLARVRSDLAQLPADDTAPPDETLPKLKPVKIPREFKKSLGLWQTYKAEMTQQERRPEFRKFVEWARVKHKTTIVPAFKRFLDNYSRTLRRRKK